MLIKVSNTLYINTHHLLAIASTPSEARLYMADGSSYLITSDHTEYLKLKLEVDEADAMITQAEMELQTPLSIESQIAIHLREVAVYGATQMQLESIFNLDNGSLSDTLSELIAGEIVIGVTRLSDSPIYFHASHVPAESRIFQDFAIAPRTSQRLSASTATPLNAPAECIEPTADPKTGD